MDTFLIVVVIGLVIGMMVLMFRYAGFIHQGPSANRKDETPEEDRSDPPSREDED